MTTVYAWDGQILTGEYLALVVPAPSAWSAPLLGAACSGQDRAIVWPERLGAFLREHAGRRLVTHNAASLYWILDSHFREPADEGAREVLRAAARECRLHDIILLDSLVLLAEEGCRFRARRLSDLASSYNETVPEDPENLLRHLLVAREGGTLNPSNLELLDQVLAAHHL